MSAGEHTVTLCIDNGWQLPYRPDGHGVSDALGATWNGVAGAITLELFNRVWIERVKVNAQLPQAAIQVHLKKWDKPYSKTVSSRTRYCAYRY